MAYLRWSEESEWFIFWEMTDPETVKEEHRLAIWHRDVTGPGFSATYPEIRAMLSKDDFSAVPGFDEWYRRLFREVLTRFVEGVDAEFGSVGGNLGE